MAEINLNEAMRAGVEHHQAGRLREADGTYRNILEHVPEHAGALHMLGVLATQAGRFDEAIELIGRAILVEGDVAEMHYNLGVALQGRGRWEEAAVAYQRAITLRPEWAGAHYNLGVARHRAGQGDAATAAYVRAIALKGDYAEAYSNLSDICLARGRLDEAVSACRKAIALQPKLADAQTNLGLALQARGKWSEAVAAGREAVALRAESPEAHFNLGNALQGAGLLEEAIDAYRHAIARRRDYAQAHSNLSNALRDQGSVEEAVAAGRRAVELNPKLAEAYTDLGNALQDMGEVVQAVAAHRKAVAINPQLADAHHNLALGLLVQGEFTEGWREYEWRWGCAGLRGGLRFAERPRWEGSAGGQTILVYAEQGLGDVLQFARYLPLIARRGLRVIVDAPAALGPVLRTIEGVAEVHPTGGRLPPFDVQIPMLSLPGIFGTTLESIPGEVPYVRADEQLTRAWAGRLDRGLKVGLCWAGSIKNRSDALARTSPSRHKSMVLDMLAPLGGVAGVTFYSLQKGVGAGEAQHPPTGMKLIDWTGEIKDFGDTAALISCLDLVVTIDTSVAHLAGAMGKPTWTLLPFAPGQFWLLGRVDSPWYPTMRLFRQRTRGDWTGVVGEVAEALGEWAGTR